MECTFGDLSYLTFVVFTAESINTKYSVHFPLENQVAAVRQYLLLLAELLSFCIFDLDRIALLQIPVSKILFSYTIIQHTNTRV